MAKSPKAFLSSDPTTRVHPIVADAQRRAAEAAGTSWNALAKTLCARQPTPVPTRRGPLDQFTDEAENNPTGKGEAERDFFRLVEQVRRHTAAGQVDAAVESAFYAGTAHQKFRSSHHGSAGRKKQNAATDERRARVRELFKQVSPQRKKDECLAHIYASIGRKFKPPLTPRIVRRDVTGH